MCHEFFLIGVCAPWRLKWWKWWKVNSFWFQQASTLSDYHYNIHSGEVSAPQTFWAIWGLESSSSVVTSSILQCSWEAGKLESEKDGWVIEVVIFSDVFFFGFDYLDSISAAGLFWAEPLFSLATFDGRLMRCFQSRPFTGCSACGTIGLCPRGETCM